MKSLGRIFELGNNGNKPFKNKYVIVYENKTYFVCKEFGTDYPKIIRKERCIDYSDYMNPNLIPSSWNCFIVDRKHEADIKVDFSESIMKSRELKGKKSIKREWKKNIFLSGKQN